MPKLDDLARWSRNYSGMPVKRLEGRNKQKRKRDNKQRFGRTRKLRKILPDLGS